METRLSHTSVPTETPFFIEARALSKRFDEVAAVDRVSFRVRQGDLFGFLGSSGVGKDMRRDLR